VLTPAPENNGGLPAVSRDAASAASFSARFGEKLHHRLQSCLAFALAITWCKKTFYRSSREKVIGY